MAEDWPTKQTHRCLGCGKLIFFFKNETELLAGHEKPMAMIGVEKSTGCALFNRLDARELWELHKGTEQLESPELLRPIRG